MESKSIGSFKEEHVVYRYKYLPFSDGSLKTISEGTIKFANALDFNDPFDCLPYYDTKSINKVPSMRPDLFKAAGKRRNLSPADRIQQTGRFVARLRKRIEDGSFARDLLAKVGVVSLSRNAISIPMWSHYADFHRGLVLEFRIPMMGYPADLSVVDDRLLPLPVRYSETRPTIFIGEEYPEDLVEKIVLTKSIDWKYEEEERVVDQTRGPGIRPYRRDEILCSVITGMRMPLEHLERLKLVVAGLRNKIPSLAIYKATPVSDEYKLEVADHPRLSLTR